MLSFGSKVWEKHQKRTNRRSRRRIRKRLQTDKRSGEVRHSASSKSGEGQEKHKGRLWLGEEYFSGDGIAAIRGRISSSTRAVLQDAQPFCPTCPRRFLCHRVI